MTLRPAARRPAVPVLPAVAGLVLLIAVAATGWAVQRGLTAGLDRAGLLAMAGGPVAFWRFWTALGDSGVRLAIAGAALAALVVARHRRRAMLLLATVGGGLAINSTAKLIVGRVRPGLLPHLDRVDTFSFPNGHAANSMVLALALALFLAPRRYRTAALPAAVAVSLLVGLSRVALAVHWPSDVLAGWCEGAGWVLLVHATAPVLVRWVPPGRTGRG